VHACVTAILPGARCLMPCSAADHLNTNYCMRRRKALAIYPVILLYASIGWLGLVKSK
jgi:hypothetical protein